MQRSSTTGFSADQPSAIPVEGPWPKQNRFLHAMCCLCLARHRRQHGAEDLVDKKPAQEAAANTSHEVRHPVRHDHELNSHLHKMQKSTSFKSRRPSLSIQAPTDTKSRRGTNCVASLRAQLHFQAIPDLLGLKAPLPALVEVVIPLVVLDALVLKRQREGRTTAVQLECTAIW